MLRDIIINLIEKYTTSSNSKLSYNDTIETDLFLNKKLFKHPNISIVSKSGDKLDSKNLKFHDQPDGADIFEDTDPGNKDGYLYVSNSEIHSIWGRAKGGVGVYKFNKNNTLIDYYRILENTRSNCSGGKYKNYWLSCEEYGEGQVWLTDPSGKEQPKALPSMGRFSHEAVAYCNENGCFYLTEDTMISGGGGIYRYKPKNGFFQRIGNTYQYKLQNNNIGKGKLEICVGERVKNLDKPIYNTYWDNIDTTYTPVKFNQKQNELKKNKWEGIVYSPKGYIFIANQSSGIYCYNIKKDRVMHISNTSNNKLTELNHPDNIYITKNNNLLVAEDSPGNAYLQIWLYKFNYETNKDFPIVENKEIVLTCKNHKGSELSGLSVYKDILMFASQRGRNREGKGIVYQIKGFRDHL